MFFAKRAMFLKFDARRMLLFIFRQRIIAALTIAAFEGDDFSHYIFAYSLTASLLSLTESEREIPISRDDQSR
jgi:hypothetical protein